MKHIALVVLLLFSAVGAEAWTHSGLQTIKIKRGSHQSPQPNQLFSNSAARVDGYPVIPGIPFVVDGETCSSENLLDVACPFDDSVAPEVVFSYTPLTDETITLDLCNSDYDTKVYVLDTFENVIACNDDFYDFEPCAEYSSFLIVDLTGGVEYLIVVDGYGEECGNFTLAIDAFDGCTVSPEPHGMAEGEPSWFPGYVDQQNGGCVSEGGGFQPIFWSSLGTGDCGYLNGVSGWHEGPDFETFDFDFFEIVAASSTIDVSLTAEYPMLLLFAEPSCEAPNFLIEGESPEGCGTLTASASVVPGQSYWVVVAPLDQFGPLIDFDYTLQVCGHASAVVPNAEASWGEIKSLYR